MFRPRSTQHDRVAAVAATWRQAGVLSEDLGGGFLGDLVAAGWRRVLNGAVVSATVHALLCGVRMSLGGEATPSAGFVLGDHGFAQVADFQ